MSEASTGSPWHPGETAIQATIGAVARMAEIGRRVVRDAMPDQHRAFFAQLPFVVVGSVDPRGEAWATLLSGVPGFVAAPTPTTLTLDARPDPADPAAAGLRAGEAVGLLGIELHTRRRNRANGVLRASPGGILRVEVAESFGNCPQYITLRDAAPVAVPPRPGRPEESDGLDAAARALIAAADTFFVASYFEQDGHRRVDVSHRGGKAGFVRVAPDGTLTIPDFSGNQFFATLGNIRLNRRAGLVFPDFATGDLLQITGEAEVVLDSPEIAAFRGAERLWVVRPRRVVRRPGALPLRWAMRGQGASPRSLATGDWREAADRIRAEGTAERATVGATMDWRPYRVTRIVAESRTIRSFHLAPADGAGPLPFLAGQHLPVRVTLPGAEAPAIRTYTLSAAPSDDGYRLSVKREGAVSRHLHDRIRVGDAIEARPPAGTFTLDAAATRPAVMLAGGVGITPLLAMLRHLVHEGARTGHIRPATLFHAARSRADRPFDRELADLVAAAGGAVRVVRVLSDVSDAQVRRDYDAAGRIDAALVARFAPLADADVYLCGPAAFTQALYDGLRARGVPDARLHAEAFGPSALVRTGAPPRPPASPDPVSVRFAESDRAARWSPGSGTLLELAEASGLSPAFGCREGSCGTCRTRLLAGAVTYAVEPAAEVAPDEVLPCRAVPAAGTADLRLAL